ncbi:MAG: tRNA (N(6)-L-threonylcarbamoyladenosine(37)-C(2))-methylthiotransferase MtaB [Bacteroidales bacterium]
MIKRKIAFQTFGCKLNFAETSTIARLFPEDQFEHVSFKEPADIYVVHSCTVTSKAEKKTRNAIEQAKKLNPSAKLAVMGCYAQLRPKELEERSPADIILGNREKYRLPGIIISENQDRVVEVSNNDIQNDVSYKPAYSSNGRTRSFLKIQDGCDNFCAYCTVPYARGRSRNNSISQVISNATEIGHSAIKEIILTGVNIGDFGKNSGESFFDLIRKLDRVKGIERFRISSIEPDLLSQNIIDFIARSRKFQEHFHIPLQSGNDNILQRMGRQYSTQLFAEKVRYIKQVMPNACIAADLIVGFPGETEEQFNETLDFVQSLPLSYLHIFTYSMRPYTKAAIMKNQISQATKKARSVKMHKASEAMKTAFYRSQKDSTQSVLWEDSRNGSYIQGWTGNYIKVTHPYAQSKINTIEKVILKEFKNSNFYIE